jgi:hypothetical protein
VNGPSSELGPFVASPTKVEQQKSIATTNKHLPTGVKYNGYQRFDNAVHYTSSLSGALLAIEVGVTLWDRSSVWYSSPS